MSDFTNQLGIFNKKYGSQKTFKGFVRENPYDPKSRYPSGFKTYNLLDNDGSHNENFYKWQFLYAITTTGLFPRDNICLEVTIPKGNKESNDMRPDGVIFDTPKWKTYYKHFKQSHERDLDSKDWLAQHMLVELEFKDEGSYETSTVWDIQLKPYMQASEHPRHTFGILYDDSTVYLFKRTLKGHYVRLDDEKNRKGEASQTKDLDLDDPDGYDNILSFKRLMQDVSPKYHKPTLDSLHKILSIDSKSIKNKLSNILQTMNDNALTNQKGYDILIQAIAAKIFDERSAKQYHKELSFYITQTELEAGSLSSPKLQKFVTRIRNLFNRASGM